MHMHMCRCEKEKLPIGSVNEKCTPLPMASKGALMANLARPVLDRTQVSRKYGKVFHIIFYGPD